MGGQILPGLELIREALPNRAAGLRHFKGREEEFMRRDAAIGTCTGQALEAGALSAFRGGIKEALSGIEKELGQPAHIYLTGGNADFLEPISQRVETKALLSLSGLHIIAQRWVARGAPGGVLLQP